MTNWPHAPLHWFQTAGIYFLTASTYLKQSMFRTAEDLNYLQGVIFDATIGEDFPLQAWSFFPNHYHLIVTALENLDRLRGLIRDIHSLTARELNARYGATGRRVWFQFRDTHLTFQKSYLARLNYVHQNPVHHGVVANATNYAWCSASWFERTAKASFVESVKRFKTDRVNVPDDFAVEKI